MRRHAVRALSACLAALYAERKGAKGTRPSRDETLMICPAPRALKWGRMACTP